MEKAEKVERFFSDEHHFKEAIGVLRDLALKTKMEETYKWMCPTYTLNGKNVIAICKFKKHFGVWFFNGVFLSDPHRVLVNAQEGKTQAMRHWKFNSKDEIDTQKVLCYINEAIENRRRGLKLAPRKAASIKVIIPKLLKDALRSDAAAKRAFEKLSPYNKKEYSEYIANAKQEKTKLSRLEKILPMIARAEGLNDKYKK